MVKNAWSYTSTPLYVFMSWCLIKNQDNFTFHCSIVLLKLSQTFALLQGYIKGQSTQQHSETQ
jgi:hypothetical protein